jgi:uncharacterized protein (DUF4415 family)
MSAKRVRTKSKTDWARIDAMKDEDIDTSDIPELGPEFFKNAISWPGPKKQITLRLDPDILRFFRKTGRRYQSRINAVLRRYMELQKPRTRDKRKGILRYYGSGVWNGDVRTLRRNRV